MEVEGQTMIRNVIIIHGFADISKLWRKLVGPLERDGFRPVLFNYPTFRNSIDLPIIASKLHRFAGDQLDGQSYQLVGHSQGGLIAEWLDHFIRPVELRRVITIATPFQGNSLPLMVPRSILQHMPFSRQQLKGLTCWSPALRQLLYARWNHPTRTPYFNFIGYTGRRWKFEGDGVVALCEARRICRIYLIRNNTLEFVSTTTTASEAVLHRSHLPHSWIRVGKHGDFQSRLSDVLQHGHTETLPVPPPKQFSVILPAALERQLKWPADAKRWVTRPTLDPTYRIVYGETSQAATALMWNEQNVGVQPGLMTYVISAADFNRGVS